jgi:hypothetical protein
MKKQLFTQITLGALYLLLCTGVNAQVKPKTVIADTVKVKVHQDLTPHVIAVRSISAGRAKGYAVYGDYLEVTVRNLDVMLKMADSIAPSCSDSSILLCINDFARNDLALTDVNRAKGTLVFRLDRSSKTLTQFRIYFTRLWGKLEVNNITVSVSGLKPISTDVKRFYLLLTSRHIVYFAIVFLIFMVISMALLVKRTNIIRAGSDGSPFSLSQSQLAFWTLLVSFSIIYVWAVTEEFPVITYPTLGLLGISVATTAGAKMVTYSKKAPGTYKDSHGFLIDILSDETSVNIHRFQMVLWTLILGVIFVVKVIDQLKIPEFSEDLLILMGLSSGTYVLLKNSESTGTPEPTNATPKNNDTVPSEPDSPAFG